ncbi:MAG TPA: polyprenyl diphosphate synthase [Acidimicrobiales bacterium]|nr:polyprenyl diphosphate synthase [Acidimicrobiales bacterium]
MRRPWSRAALLRPFYRLYERRLESSLPADALPRHVGVILDGHRRFAREEGGAYRDSYEAGMAKLEELLDWCAELKIKAVTAWVLSTENLRRPTAELEPYFDVLSELFGRLPEEAKRLRFTLSVSGSLDLLPPSLALRAKEAVDAVEALGVAAPAMNVNIALCYGGRQEIVDACRSLVSDLAAQGVEGAEIAERIDAVSLSRHLYAADLPDTDLVIRTSGESRMSGFLLWQSAFAEFAFVDPYWPSFRRVDLLRALRDFTRRERRFGA